MPILLLHRDDAHDEKLVKKLASHQVEGLILRPNPNREECSEISMVLDRYNMPVVSVDYALAKTQKYDFVGTADELGGQLAAEHFLEYGHRRMAGFFTPVESLLLRKKGFEEAIKCQPGIAPPLIVTDFEFGSEVPAYHRIKSILSESDAPTAFFVGGDFILPAMYRAANELGLRIPEDLSIIGFGDVDFSRHLVPPATTLKQDAYEIGVHAAQLLIDRIESGDRKIPVREFRFKPQLIERGSTAAREG